MVVAVLLVLLAGCFGGQRPGAGTEQEPDGPLAPLPDPIHDERAVVASSAGVGGIPCGQAMRLCIEHPFDLKRDAVLDAHLSWSSPASGMNLQLLHGEEIVSISVAGTSETSSRMRETLAPGEYVLRVNLYRVANDAYVLDATFADADRIPSLFTTIAARLDVDGQTLEILPGTPRHVVTVEPTGVDGGEPTVRMGGGHEVVTVMQDVAVGKDGAWTHVEVHPTTGDPILTYDPVLERFVKGDLTSDALCVMLSVSPDGRTWSRQPDACSATADYPKLAAGPAGPDADPLTEDSITYLCHNIAPPANPCLVSHDGARSFVPGGPAAGACGGITSYPAIRHDGVVVLPAHGACREPVFHVSRDSGLTWRTLHGPAGHAADAGALHAGSIVAVSFENDRLAAFWIEGDGARLAWTDDLQTWTGGLRLHVPDQPIIFNSVTLVDDEAILGFLARGVGDVWRMTVAAIPLEDPRTTVVYQLDDPAQVGEICNQGARCQSGRNMLDFITADAADGTTLIAWSDGCDACPLDTQSADRVVTLTRVTRLAEQT